MGELHPAPAPSPDTAVPVLLRPQRRKLAALVDEAGSGVPAAMGFPKHLRSKISWNGLSKRIDDDILWRTDVSGIFSNAAAITRPVGAPPAGAW